ncbi:hypothetical protein WR25_21685 [Diploscapter pachys]|uniref:Transthyretin-like family protein n=1 Tax=Diploscapter pachys TaxID=2018661 RepID=A0A2A2LBJ7_9BILA|nr:hypothetical protein WR25_21685 [Diploscapter pachys]
MDRLLQVLSISFLIGLVSSADVHVRGQIHCSNRIGSQRMTVRLMERDFSGYFLLGLLDPDDELDRTEVLYGEHFTLDGNAWEIGDIEPYLAVTHSCNDGVEKTVAIPLEMYRTQNYYHHNYMLGDFLLTPDLELIDYWL